MKERGEEGREKEKGAGSELEALGSHPVGSR